MTKNNYIRDGELNDPPKMVHRSTAPIFTYSKSIRWNLYKDEVIGNIFDNPELLEVLE